MTISDSTVSEVVETGGAFGIGASGPAHVIERNRARNIDAAVSYGIPAGQGLRAIVQDYVIVNTTAGTYAICQDEGSVACLDNVVTNFATALAGCTLDDGNRTS